MSISGYLNTYLLYPLAERRMGRDIRSKIATLESDQLSSIAQRTDRKTKQLHRILSIASIKVPYYRDLFKQLNFVPDRILKDPPYLKQLPYLDKEIVTEQGSRMLNEDFRPSDLHERKTGGSTGISTQIYYDQDALDWTAAVSRYAQRVTGRKPTDVEVLLSSNLVYASTFGQKIADQLKDLAMNRVSIFTHSFSDEDVKTLWNRIKSLSPHLIQGHPSTLYALACYIEKSGHRERNAVKVFESTGESIDAKKIALIESQVGCKVYNRYGTAEFGVTAESVDDPSKLEIIDYIVHHETVSLGNGLEEIVGTTTTNIAMPLIRYRSGDIGEIKNENGRDFIVNLQGRVHDLVEIGGTPYPTHYIKSLLDQVGGVDEFQVVQKRNGTKTLNVVLRDPSLLGAVENKVQSKFQGKIAVSAVKFENLVRVGWRDKFRYVVKEAT